MYGCMYTHTCLSSMNKDQEYSATHSPTAESTIVIVACYIYKHHSNYVIHNHCNLPGTSNAMHDT